MKRKRYTEEKIMAMLKAHEAGVSVPGLSRRHGLAENTVYRWKSKFGGMEISEAKRLCELEAENSKLKRLLEGRTRLRCRSSLGENGDGRAAAAGRAAPDKEPHKQ
jgi:putative transposase